MSGSKHNLFRCIWLTYVLSIAPIYLEPRFYINWDCYRPPRCHLKCTMYAGDACEACSITYISGLAAESTNEW